MARTLSRLAGGLEFESRSGMDVINKYYLGSIFRLKIAGPIFDFVGSDSICVSKKWFGFEYVLALSFLFYMIGNWRRQKGDLEFVVLSVWIWV